MHTGLPASILERDDLMTVMESGQGMDDYGLNFFYEAKVEFVYTHKIGSNSMEFPLLFSLSRDNTVYAY